MAVIVKKALEDGLLKTALSFLSIVGEILMFVKGPIRPVYSQFNIRINSQVNDRGGQIIEEIEIMWKV